MFSTGILIICITILLSAAVEGLASSTTRAKQYSSSKVLLKRWTGRNFRDEAIGDVFIRYGRSSCGSFGLVLSQGVLVSAYSKQGLYDIHCMAIDHYNAAQELHTPVRRQYSTADIDGPDENLNTLLTIKLSANNEHIPVPCANCYYLGAIAMTELFGTSACPHGWITVHKGLAMRPSTAENPSSVGAMACIDVDRGNVDSVRKVRSRTGLSTSEGHRTSHGDDSYPPTVTLTYVYGEYHLGGRKVVPCILCAKL